MGGQCHNCPKPALFVVGDEGPGFCLDCYAKFQEMLDRQMENQERMLNYLSDQVEAAVGIYGLAPRFEPRRPRTVLLKGGVTMHNINIDRSTIGLVNTGTIGQVDTAVGVMKASGDSDAASAFRDFTEKLFQLQDVDAELKNKLLEVLGALASEATLPRPQRRASVTRALLTELSTIAGGAAGVAQLYSQFAPTFASLFGG